MFASAWIWLLVAASLSAAQTLQTNTPSSSTASAATASVTSLYPASPYSDGSAVPDGNNTLPGLTPPTMPADNWAGISGGVIAGIVVGVILGGAALIYLGWFLVRRIRSRRPSSSGSEDSEATLSEEKPGFASRPRRTKHGLNPDENMASSSESDVSEEESPSIDRNDSVTHQGVKKAVHYKKGLSLNTTPNRHWV